MLVQHSVDVHHLPPEDALWATIAAIDSSDPDEDDKSAEEQAKEAARRARVARRWRALGDGLGVPAPTEAPAEFAAEREANLAVAHEMFGMDFD